MNRFPRIALYGHDSFGLGHIRRNLAIANRVVREVGEVSVLLITGSPMVGEFHLPPRVDVLRVPSVTKDETGAYRARHLNLPLEEILALRSRLVRDALIGFRPDLLLVDHAPAGVGGELRDLLYELRTTTKDLKMVLGLRDVIDHPATVRSEWTRNKVYPLLEHVYDEVWMYGPYGVGPDPGEYGLDHDCTHMGYLVKKTGAIARRPAVSSAVDNLEGPGSVRTGGRRSTPRLVVTTGGGEDGYAVLSAATGALEHLNGAGPDATLVGGPFLPAEQETDLRERIKRIPNARFTRFSARLGGLLDRADAIVTMGGYNSICDVLARGLPAVVVPRTHPRQEQLIRARALEQRGVVEVMEPTEATAESMARAISGVLRPEHRSSVRAAASALDLDGLDRVGNRLRALLGPETGTESTGVRASA